MLWQLQISMYLFFFVFQLVFWCFNTHPKTSMTWFLVLFCFFLFVFVFWFGCTRYNGTFCVYAQGIKNPY